jgi:hypothetical protein
MAGNSVKLSLLAINIEFNLTGLFINKTALFFYVISYALKHNTRDETRAALSASISPATC